MKNYSGSVITEQCLSALEISHQPHLISLKILTIISCIIGLSSAILLAYYLYKKPVYHINIRLLLWNMCLALGLMSLGAVYLSADSLVVFAQYQDDPCKMLIGYSACHNKRSMVMILPTSLVINNALALAVERAYATYHYRTYDMKQSKLIGLSFISFQWVVGSAPVLLNYLIKQQEDRVGTMPYCISAMVTPDVIMPALFVAFTFDAVSLSFMIVLLIINSRNQHLKVRVEDATADGGHLSERYQLAENLKTTRMLIPSMVAHIVINLVSSLDAYHITTSGQLENDADVVRLAVYNQLASLLVSFYAPTFCVACLVQSPQLFAHLRNQWGCFRPTTSDGVATAAVQPLPPMTTATAHFERLNEQWRSKPLRMSAAPIQETPV